jgi:hypothetical protein
MTERRGFRKREDRCQRIEGETERDHEAKKYLMWACTWKMPQSCPLMVWRYNQWLGSKI